MNVAILGATSQIAKDLIVRLINQRQVNLDLYSRRKDELFIWLDKKFGNNIGNINFLDINDFSNRQSYNAIINFIGVGDPDKIKKIGAGILSLTNFYDERVISYLKEKTDCKYIFISSGAAYGDVFSELNQDRRFAKFKINELNFNDWYGFAKYSTEIKHRSLRELKIYDLRVFGYFSENQDMDSKFILSELYRAIKSKSKFITNKDEMVRDYIHPDDFFQIIQLLLANEIKNNVFDCYSREPIRKHDLLEFMEKKYKLLYEISDEPLAFAYNNRRYYFSKSKSLGDVLNYEAKFKSIDTIEAIFNNIL